MKLDKLIQKTKQRIEANYIMIAKCDVIIEKLNKKLKSHESI